MATVLLLHVFTHTHLTPQIISSDISELQKNQATTVAKIAQYKRKLMDLSHRVLQVAASFHLQLLFPKKSEIKRDDNHLHLSWSLNKCPNTVFPCFIFPASLLLFIFITPPLPLCSWQVLIKQEIQRKSGYAIQVDEEHLRVQLDTIQSELNAPTQFKASHKHTLTQVFFFFSICVATPKVALQLYNIIFTVCRCSRCYLRQTLYWMLCFVFLPPGPVEWTDVPNPYAEPLWSCEVRGALQCWCRPAQRNQTSKSQKPWLRTGVCCRPQLQRTSFPRKALSPPKMLLSRLSLSALEAAAGWLKSLDQRHQRRPGGHQTYRARPERQRTHERRNPELSLLN